MGRAMIAIGAEVGSYRILSLLGEGGTIVVHDVHQLFEAASQRLEGINRGFRK